MQTSIFAILFLLLSTSGISMFILVDEEILNENNLDLQNEEGDTNQNEEGDTNQNEITETDEKKIMVETKFLKSDYKSNESETVKLFVVIHNNHDHSIELKQDKKPVSYHDDFFNFTSLNWEDYIIHSESSYGFNLSSKLDSSIKPGTYYVGLAIPYFDGNDATANTDGNDGSPLEKNLVEIVEIEIVAETMEFPYEILLFLLASFIIPAQIIERFVEAMRGIIDKILKKNADDFFNEERISISRKIIDQLIPQIKITQSKNTDTVHFATPETTTVKTEPDLVVETKTEKKNNPTAKKDDPKVSVAKVVKEIDVEDTILDKTKNYSNTKKVETVKTRTHPPEYEDPESSEDVTSNDDKFPISNTITYKKISNSTTTKDPSRTSNSKDESSDNYKTVKDNVDKNILEMKTAVYSHETYKIKVTMWSWIISLPGSFIIGSIFSFFDLGILQIIGNIDENVKTFDAIINGLFISGGTQPIHKLINLLEKARNPISETSETTTTAKT